MEHRGAGDCLDVKTSRWMSKHLSIRIMFVFLALTTLACGFFGAEARSGSSLIVIQNQLPTLTPTLAANTEPENRSPIAANIDPTPTPPATIVASTPQSLPTLTPTPTAHPVDPAPQQSEQTPTIEITPLTPAPAVPPETSTSLPTTIPNPLESSWSFANTQIFPSEFEAGLTLYGDVVNNSASAQELALVTGKFYDAQGQLVADEESTLDFWPVEIVPAGGRLPFELTIFDAQSIANFDLSAESVSNDQTPHQQFEFSEVDQWREEEMYCLTGVVQNLGPKLQDYVVVMAVLYDDQDRVVKFGDYYEPAPGDEPVAFDICIDLANKNFARHELRAWGE